MTLDPGAEKVWESELGTCSLPTSSHPLGRSRLHLQAWLGGCEALPQPGVLEGGGESGHSLSGRPTPGDFHLIDLAAVCGEERAMESVTESP